MGNKVGKEVKVGRITVRIKEFMSDGILHGWAVIG